MKVVILAGGLGTRLSEETVTKPIWLTALGARVVGYSLPPPTSPNMFEAARVAGHITHITGDVRDEGRLMQTVQACVSRISFFTWLHSPWCVFPTRNPY